MNAIVATERKGIVCNNCRCEYPWFIHNVRYRGEERRLCTSCVLLTCKESFCPTCFGVHNLSSNEKLIRCKRCSSYSHALCLSNDPSPPPFCSSCTNPKQLIFDPREMKGNWGGANGKCWVVYKQSFLLLLTAAKVGYTLMTGLEEELKDNRMLLVTEAVEEWKKGKRGTVDVMTVEDLKNGCYDRAVSLIDFSDTSEEDDSDSEPLNHERMQKLTIGGEGFEAPSSKEEKVDNRNEAMPMKE